MHVSQKLCNYLKKTSLEDVFKLLHENDRPFFLRSAIALKNALMVDSAGQVPVGQDLVTILFTRLCELLPRILRKRAKEVEQKPPTAHGAIKPCLLIAWLYQIVGELPKGSMDLKVALEGKCVVSALRGCLKYGIAPVSSTYWAALASDCLKLARELVRVITLESASFPPPEDVYEMVVTHSRFAESLKDPSGVAETRKLELVRLLLACVSLSKATIVFRVEIWNALFIAYGAGVGIVDVSIRRLLYLATRKQDEVSSFCGSLDTEIQKEPQRSIFLPFRVRICPSWISSDGVILSRKAPMSRVSPCGTGLPTGSNCLGFVKLCAPFRLMICLIHCRFRKSKCGYQPRKIPRRAKMWGKTVMMVATAPPISFHLFSLRWRVAWKAEVKQSTSRRASNVQMDTSRGVVIPSTTN